jgi:uncharacterized protein (TIGR03435 family)
MGHPHPANKNLPNFCETGSVLGNMRRLLYLALFTTVPLSSYAQAKFDVDSIKPTMEHVQYDRNGETTLSYGTLRMHDVTVKGCIAFAYSISLSQISGPASLTDRHYDIIAKAAPDTTETQMRQMTQSLLADRFHLTLHHSQKEMRGYVLTVFANPPKDPTKFHPSAAPGVSHHENSVSGTTAHNITMQQFADFLSGVLDGPVADGTKLPGEYDLKLEFAKYVDLHTDNSELPGAEYILNSALKGELGLQLTPRKDTFNVLVVDHVEGPDAN